MLGNGWVSVKDKLPKCDHTNQKLLLCYYPNGNDNFAKHKLVWSSYFRYEKGVSHWREAYNPTCLVCWSVKKWSYQ